MDHPIVSTRTADEAAEAARLIEQEMSARWLERGRQIHGALVALVARQHAVFLGSPGEAKSALIDDLRSRVTGARGFKLLMTRFTTPEEVFGPISISALQQDRYARSIEGYLPTAHLPFLDEPFKAGPSILNTLLTVMNEREFTNDGRVIPVPLLALFGASNEMPQGEELGALWDRYSLRYVTDPLRGASLRRFMAQQRDLRLISEREHTSTHIAVPTPVALAMAKTTLSLDDLDTLHQASLVAQSNLPDRVFDLYEDILRELQKHGFKLPSTRRTGWALSLVAANAALGGRTIPNETDLAILGDVLWDTIKEAREVGVLVLKTANPRLAEANDIIDSVMQVAQACNDYWADTSNARAQRNSKVIETRGKIAEEGGRLKRLYNEAKGAGEDTTEIEALVAQAKRAYDDVTKLTQGEGNPF